MSIQLHHVSKSYHRGSETVHALQDISFQIDPGEMVSLMGPSGCGKSTCLNVIAGVDRADEGTIHVCGRDLATIDESALIEHRRRSVGIVFQAFHLLPHMTLEENIALPLALSNRRDPERVHELIERVGLAHRKSHYPSELSGGEQQRTAVARALVHRPAVLIGDEPTGNLDQHTGTEVLQLLDELRREEGTTLLLATHDANIASRSGRIIHIRDGRIDLGEAA